MFSSLFGNPSQKEFIIMGCREKAGMFSCFIEIIALMKCHEMGYYKGIEIDCKEKGVYYDRNYGNNWWNYYFAPVCYGKKENIRYIDADPPYALSCQTEKHTSREEGFALLQKYVHIKPHIQKKIDDFERDNLKNHFVISIHYRGTDKVTEAPFVAYERILHEVFLVMDQYGKKNYKIFIATDEYQFLNYMIDSFGDMICFYKDAIRSNDGLPIHLNPNFSPYKLGEDAVIDCVLLSKGNYLIRTSSNLSYISTFFNPNMPVKEMNFSIYWNESEMRERGRFSEYNPFGTY